MGLIGPESPDSQILKLTGTMQYLKAQETIFTVDKTTAVDCRCTWDYWPSNGKCTGRLATIYGALGDSQHLLGSISTHFGFDN